MKQLMVILFMAGIFFTACNTGTSPSATERKLTPRDRSITSGNAYSDLFLDSLAVEQFITRQQLNDTIANDMRSFYNARNYQFAWFTGAGLTEQTFAFNSLYDYEEDSTRKALDGQLDNLMTDDSLSPSANDEGIIKTELSLTWRFINYVWSNYSDADTREGVLEAAIPSRKKPVLQLAEEALAAGNGQVVNPSYNQLRDLLKMRIDSLRSRKDSVGAAPYRDTLLYEVQQLLVNMERMKWMPAAPRGRLIVVNIPEFRLSVRNGNEETFNMDIVVGKEGHNTVMFSGDLNQVVFSPYWNIPASIVRKEILPSMEKNKNYLEEKNMEVTGEENGLPVVRQLPGEKNDLGKVKFLFPNSFNIYFHDTPYKELFNKDKRAYSHGCIRLSDPAKLARYVLQDQKEWTAEKIDSAMNSGKETYVKIKEPIPVLISYYTAWTDEKGQLKTAEDIYSHDTRLADRLFTDPRPAR